MWCLRKPRLIEAGILFEQFLFTLLRPQKLILNTVFMRRTSISAHSHQDTESDELRHDVRATIAHERQWRTRDW